MSLVVDASVALTWCLREEASAATDAVLLDLRETGGTAPAIWPLEVTNVLVGAERRGRIAAADVTLGLELLMRLPIVTDLEGVGQAWSRVFALARSERLTAYDAAYLELALRTGATLATLDQNLAAAARRLGLVTRP